MRTCQNETAHVVFFFVPVYDDCCSVFAGSLVLRRSRRRAGAANASAADPADTAAPGVSAATAETATADTAAPGVSAATAETATADTAAPGVSAATGGGEPAALGLTAPSSRPPSVSGTGLPVLAGRPPPGPLAAFVLLFLTSAISLPGQTSAPSKIRIPFAVIMKKHCITRATFDDLLSVFTWSLRCLATGIFPSRRHDDRDWMPVDRKRQRLSAKQMPLRGILTEIRGDWACMKEVFRLPGWRDAAGCCWRSLQPMSRCGFVAPMSRGVRSGQLCGTCICGGGSKGCNLPL